MSKQSEALRKLIDASLPYLQITWPKPNQAILRNAILLADEVLEAESDDKISKIVDHLQAIVDWHYYPWNRERMAYEAQVALSELGLDTIAEENRGGNGFGGMKPKPKFEMTDDFLEEIKGTLNYLDQLFESLPAEKIQEFARSEHFEVYKRIFDVLGIQNEYDFEYSGSTDHDMSYEVPADLEEL
jgi:hypothetical protein